MSRFQKLGNVADNQGIAMPVELLQTFSRKTLPMTITDITNMDKLRILQTAGHVIAQFPDVGGAKRQVARVLAIAELGQEALRITQTAVSYRRSRFLALLAWQPSLHGWADCTSLLMQAPAYNKFW